MASTFSIDGIISGLKTSDIIQQLMAIERQPLQLLQQRASDESTRLQAVESIKAQVSNLLSAVASLSRRNATNAKLATADTPTVLTATATSDAVNGSFKVTVSQLATATRVYSSGPMGQVVNAGVPLANAGFRVAPITEKDGNPATFTINGHTITIDNTTTLDDGSANSVIAKINSAGAGVTASLVADADGRPANRIQIVSDPGQTIQLGSLGDTSNLLRVLNLADATVEGYTAASVTGGAVAAGALNTSITINGVTTVINQTDTSYTAAQNAAFIANAINNTAGSTVTAIDNGDGTITLQQKTLGSQQKIDITTAGSGTGFSVGTTQNGTDRVLSTMSLGVTDIGAALTSARLVTPISGLDASGNGSFTINGVTIAYRATDSITSIINRINASNAGVTAFYDPVQDRLRLSANETGARTIALADVTGNFLAATGVLGATQQIGQNAIFTIDTVNGGQPLSSSSNTVTGYVPGVTLQLKATSTTPVTVTVQQDSAATVKLVKSFVDAFNATVDMIEQQTKYDPDKKQASPLTGDSSVLDIERMVRSITSSSALGATGTYRSLADLGISTGAYGSAVGTTSHLTLDENKLKAALESNPQAVESVFSGFLATLGNPSGAGNVTAVSGTPWDQHESGTYYVKVLDTSGNVEVRFVTSDGREVFKRSATITPGSSDSTLIPGVRLQFASTLTVGEDAFSMTVDSRGVMVRLNDYLENLLGPSGFFAAREDSSNRISRELAKQMDEMEQRLQAKEDELNRKFSALETALAQLQTQSNALLAQIMKLGS